MVAVVVDVELEVRLLLVEFEHITMELTLTVLHEVAELTLLDLQGPRIDSLIALRG